MNIVRHHVLQVNLEAVPTNSKYQLATQTAHRIDDGDQEEEGGWAEGVGRQKTVVLKAMAMVIVVMMINIV